MKIWPGFGLGIGFAFVLLGAISALMLSDHVVQRYGAVFAVGRAMDKQLYAERTCPQVLVLGNSRVDNGVIPRVLQEQWRSHPRVFNLGMPGTNAQIGYGSLVRLERQGCLDDGKLRLVIVGLDESYLQDEDSLGYRIFFADRKALLAEGDWHTWIGSWIRLWSYSDNLRELREPEKALRFVKATFEKVEPVGGSAERHLGYRAGFGAENQNAAQVRRQEVAAANPPSPAIVAYLFRIKEILDRHHVSMAVMFPPLLTRATAYLDPAQAHGAYVALRQRLETTGAAVIVAPDPVPRDPVFFLNAGHLNDRGAQLFTSWLGKVLADRSPWLEEKDKP
jgi:hypothetical protein